MGLPHMRYSQTRFLGFSVDKLNQNLSVGPGKLVSNRQLLSKWATQQGKALSAETDYPVSISGPTGGRRKPSQRKGSTQHLIAAWIWGNHCIRRAKTPSFITRNRQPKPGKDKSCGICHSIV